MDYRSTSASPYYYRAPLHLPPFFPYCAAYMPSGTLLITLPCLSLCFPNSPALLCSLTLIHCNKIPLPYFCPGDFRCSLSPGTPPPYYQLSILYLRPPLMRPCGALPLYLLSPGLIPFKYISKCGSLLTLLNFSTILSPLLPSSSSIASLLLNKWWRLTSFFVHKILPHLLI